MLSVKSRGADPVFVGLGKQHAAADGVLPYRSLPVRSGRSRLDLKKAKGSMLAPLPVSICRFNSGPTLKRVMPADEACVPAIPWLVSSK
jgi:hypothetical protein